jgi:hypothetical protein
MPAAKHRINSTGRKRIARESVDVRLEPMQAGKPLAAGVTVNLTDHDFPAAAAVVLEAYQRSTGMRFECGTVGRPSVPTVLHLNEIDAGERVLFRLKVVDGESAKGKILGMADRIRPANADDLDGRKSIFPIMEMSLDPEVWAVRIDDDGPTLCLNFRIAGFKHKILENSLLQGVILPAAFRTVLESLVDEPVPDDDDENDWRSQWLRFLRESFGIDDDLAVMAPNEKREWVDSTVKAFCQAHDFVDNIRSMAEGSVS